MTPPDVYVTQETLQNFSKAEVYGRVKFMSVDKRDDFTNNRNSEHNERMLGHLSHALREFREDQDFIVLTGSPYVQVAVFWLLGLRGVRQLQVLRWSNRDLDYKLVTLNLRQETIRG